MAPYTNLNWAKLYSQGRCKAVGIPWNEEEDDAVHNKHIPAEYVRMGILEVDDYETRVLAENKEFEKSGEIPLIKRDKEKLLEMAHLEGIPATSAASKEALVKEIELKNKKRIPKAVSKKDKEKKVEVKPEPKTPVIEPGKVIEPGLVIEPKKKSDKPKK